MLVNIDGFDQGKRFLFETFDEKFLIKIINDLDFSFFKKILQ